MLMPKTKIEYLEKRSRDVEMSRRETEKKKWGQPEGQPDSDLCQECGEEIDRSVHPRARYCSARCAKLFREKNKTIFPRVKHPNCFNCGGAIPKTSRRLKWCSKECYEAGRQDIRKGKEREAQEKFYRLKESFGCALCGYDQHGVVIDAHHLGEKKFGLLAKWYGKYYEEMHQELSGCLLVCKNCHCLIHNGLIDMNDDMLKSLGFKRDESGRMYRFYELTGCPHLGAQFSHPDNQWEYTCESPEPEGCPKNTNRGKATKGCFCDPYEVPLKRETQDDIEQAIEWDQEPEIRMGGDNNEQDDFREK